MRWSRLRRHTFVCLEMIAIVALLSPAHRLNQPLQMAFQKSQADRWRCDREGREGGNVTPGAISGPRSEEHTSELQSLMRISYADFCLNKNQHTNQQRQTYNDA